MANLTETINNVVSGDDFQIVREITNVNTGQHLTNAWLTIKENNWDSTYIIQKAITSSDVPLQGVISDTGDTDTVANVKFNLTADETILLKPFYSYVYDIQVKTNTDLIYTPEIGTITAQASITSAS